MANQTIYGCVPWDTGKVRFTTPHCVKYATGCINWTGAHAGMVEVYIYACDDTYYGCVDWTTGKFEISIPDDCCLLNSCGCYCFHPADREWSATHGNYYIGDMVWYGPSWSSGALYICRKDHESSAEKAPTWGPPWSNTWWEKIVMSKLSTNESWDDYPPFGGYCLTPSHYEITLKGISSCNGWPGGVDINKTYLVPGGTGTSCIWTCTTPEDVTIMLRIERGSPYVYVKAPFSYGDDLCDSPSCEAPPCKFYFFYAPLYSYGRLVDELQNNYDGEEDCCFGEGSSAPIPVGYNGTFSYYPSTGIEAWATGIDYIAGKVVSHSGSYYLCTFNHTSSSATEPGVGVDWATVWETTTLGSCS